MKKYLFSATILLLASLSFPLELAAENLRIVSLAPALTEIVCKLGGEKYLVGRCGACDYPESVKKLPAAGSFGIPELEKILSLKPDWVIGNDLMNPNTARKLSRIGIATNFRQINDLDDYICWLKTIGNKLNKQDSVNAELTKIDTRLKQLKQCRQLPIKVLWVVNAKPLIVAGRGSLPEYALNLMQAENAAKDTPAAYYKCSVEWLLTADIDVVIWNVPNAPAKSDRVWGKVRAIRENRIIELAITDPVTRPGPRFLDAVLRVRKMLENITESSRK